MLEFDDEYKLINCTAEVAARYKLSIRGCTAMINILCAAGGVDLDKLKGLARESVREKKYQNIQERGKIKYLSNYLSFVYIEQSIYLCYIYLYSIYLIYVPHINPSNQCSVYLSI